jgi:excisionase family DNA binding protein
MAIIITEGSPEYQKLLDDMQAGFRFTVAEEVTKAVAAALGQTAGANELLTVQQAAALLDVSVATVHEHKRTGRLPYTKLAGRAYIKRSDILAAGTQHQRTAKPARSKGG